MALQSYTATLTSIAMERFAENRIYYKKRHKTKTLPPRVVAKSLRKTSGKRHFQIKRRLKRRCGVPVIFGVLKRATDTSCRNVYSLKRQPGRLGRRRWCRKIKWGCCFNFVCLRTFYVGLIFPFDVLTSCRSSLPTRRVRISFIMV